MNHGTAPERVGFGLRLVAVVLDIVFGSVLVVGVVVAASLLGASFGAGGAQAEPGPLAMVLGAMAGMIFAVLVVLPIVSGAYFLLEAVTGWTLGKLALGLAVGNPDGTKAPWDVRLDRAAVKNLGVIVMAVGGLAGLGVLGPAGGLIALVLFIGCFLALGARRQALHDRIARTAIFRRRLLAPAPPAAATRYAGVVIMLVAAVTIAAAPYVVSSPAGPQVAGVAQVPAQPAFALTVAPSSVEDALARGTSAYDARRYDEAIALYDVAARLDPTNEWTWYHRARAYYRAGKAANAVADLRHALTLNAASPDVWEWLGHAQYAQGDNAAGLAAFTKVLELAPDHATAHFFRGTGYYFLGDKDRCRRDYEEACRRGFEEGCTRVEMLKRGAA